VIAHVAWYEQPDIFRLAATYVYQILKGTKPASTRGAANEIRACDQSQDFEADRRDDSAESANAGGPGHQMTVLESRL
jgi:hypothetical protein